MEDGTWFEGWWDDRKKGWWALEGETRAGSIRHHIHQRNLIQTQHREIQLEAGKDIGPSDDDLLIGDKVLGFLSASSHLTLLTDDC